MKRVVALCFAVCMVSSVKAETVDNSFVYDKVTCDKVAAEFQQNPFKVSLENLETFRLCVSYDMPKAMAKQYSQPTFRPVVHKLQDAE